MVSLANGNPSLFHSFFIHNSNSLIAIVLTGLTSKFAELQQGHREILSEIQKYPQCLHEITTDPVIALASQ